MKNQGLRKSDASTEREQRHPLIFPCFGGFLQQLLHALHVQLLVDLLQNLIALFKAM
jgi:hypothetical protein